MAHTLIRLAASCLAAASLLVGAPIASADPLSAAVDAIDAHYEMLGGAQSRLGAPITDTFEVAAGAERDYQGGAIFYSEQTGAKALYGPVLGRYQALGGPNGQLGFPASDEADAGNGVAHVVNGVESGNFIGPRGTRIQWSSNSGVSTVPASLAGSLPSAKSPAVAAVRTSKWWWMPAALAVGLVVATAVRLGLRRARPQAQPVQAARQHVPTRARALFTHEDTLSAQTPFC